MGFYREWIFPRFLDLVCQSEELGAIRSRVLESATGHILEIGAGTGANLVFYPHSITSLTTIDRNPAMCRRIRQQIRYLEYPVDTRQADARSLPMKSASFDCAVVTFALCSIPEVERAIAEIHRVLKPSGRLLFVEHGLDADPRRQKWQHRFTPLTRAFCDGCHLDRRVADLIHAAGFSLNRLDRYYLKVWPRTFGCIYEGVATR